MMNGFLTTRRLRWISLGLVVAALVAPTAQAKTRGPGAGVSPSGTDVPLSSDDRLGPKYVPVAAPWPAGLPPQAITTVKPAGFDSGDALIGAAAAALLIAAIAGLVAVGFRIKEARWNRRSPHSDTIAEDAARIRTQLG